MTLTNHRDAVRLSVCLSVCLSVDRTKRRGPRVKRNQTKPLSLTNEHVSRDNNVTLEPASVASRDVPTQLFTSSLQQQRDHQLQPGELEQLEQRQEQEQKQEQEQCHGQEHWEQRRVQEQWEQRQEQEQHHEHEEEEHEEESDDVRGAERNPQIETLGEMESDDDNSGFSFSYVLFSLLWERKEWRGREGWEERVKLARIKGKMLVLLDDFLITTAYYF